MRLFYIGQDSDLLIHEATFEDSLVAEARSKYHSTSYEAIDVGMQMRAKFTLLTHFSQRYFKLPLITEHFKENVGIAFDNMEVSSLNVLAIIIAGERSWRLRTCVKFNPSRKWGLEFYTSRITNVRYFIYTVPESR